MSQDKNDLTTFEGGAVRHPVPYRYDLIPLNTWKILLASPEAVAFVNALYEYIWSAAAKSTGCYGVNELVGAMCVLLDTSQPGLLKHYARALYDGAEVSGYPAHGWEGGIPLDNLINHALKHLVSLQGLQQPELFQEELGDEGEDHAAHLVWNTMNIIHFTILSQSTTDSELKTRLCDMGYGKEAE